MMRGAGAGRASGRGGGAVSTGGKTTTCNGAEVGVFEAAFAEERAARCVWARAASSTSFEC